MHFKQRVTRGFIQNYTIALIGGFGAGPRSPGDIGQPLGSEAGPLQGVSHDQVIEERGVLLPDLVLLIDHPFLHSIVKRSCKSNIHR